MRRGFQLLIGAGATFGLLAGAAYLIYGGGEHEGAGTVHPNPVPAAAVADRASRQRAVTEPIAEPERGAKQILFGDLQVHTTFSADAFVRSLPLAHGEGAHPPADACDFARFCSGLDFFALTDHAESLTPQHWKESKESVRQCNAVADDPENPDVVAFIGWEWSQAGRTPEEHYGHKHVIFPGNTEGELPARPIASSGLVARALRIDQNLTIWQQLMIPILEFPRRQRYLDMRVFLQEILSVPDCKEGVNSRELPLDCREVATTPRELFEKLAQWDLGALVIAHGTTWGLYTPPGYIYDKQLSPEQHDPSLQRLIEVYSGHGNAEEYRTWRAIDYDSDGNAICPEPTEDYEPCCWRAGEIIRSRCSSAPAEECERRVREARTHYAAAGVSGHQTVPGATVEDWQGCGQCEDCYNPPLNFRPGGAVQYILARGWFRGPGGPSYAPMGMIASSDNHTARPGTGYKEYARRKMTEAAGARSREWRDYTFGAPPAPTPESRTFDVEDAQGMPPAMNLDLERQSSFFMTGGLVAVHSRGRDRGAIWDSLQRREVYGTSGERILLWFDLVNGPDGPAPMGSEVAMSSTPAFRVHAVGAFEQNPGCPPWSERELTPERMAHLCAGECYNPSDTRRSITRIEVVRIRPQQSDGEDIAGLIEDPWRSFSCEPDPAAGCRLEFDDPDFTAGARDVFYYVRAIQEPTPAVNAGGLRCEGDRCNPCYGDYRTSFEDDCLSVDEERAWSSPIFVRAILPRRSAVSRSRSPGEARASGDPGGSPQPVLK